MKVVILAGGLGTRLSEETVATPKPMVEIGGKPIIWHIMKHYARYGLKEFVIALGYKAEVIKNYFLHYAQLSCDFTVDLTSGVPVATRRHQDDWRVHLFDTGMATHTGGRLLRLRAFLGDEPFMVTYGDGVSDIDLDQLQAFHKQGGRLATVTAVRPPARFGTITFDADDQPRFVEKRQSDEGWISGGFMIMEPGIFNHLITDHSLETALLEKLAARGDLSAYRHSGFWQCMDTLRDKYNLENLWNGGNAPWKTWLD